MSDTPAPAGANPPGANPASDAHKVDDPLPPPQQFDWIDRILILVLILVFVGLFIWFSVRNDQLYQYWSFTALLTLIFVGVLRAVGIVRTGWLALGGSVTVFVGVLWITGAAYNSNRDSAQQQKVTTLESDKVKLQSDNDALKKQITEIQTSLDGLLNQNLQIVTLDAVTSKPFTGVQFRYLLQSDGSEKIAQQKDNLSTIPMTDLRDILAIAIEFGLRNLRPDSGAAGTSGTIEVQRLNLRTKPLQIFLYVNFKQSA